MQDAYAADAGDFGKFALLRALAGVHPPAAPVLRLGIVWWRVVGAPPSGDGRLVKYALARKPRLRTLDLVLFDAFREIVLAGRRSLAAVREAGVLPPTTAWFDEPIPSGRVGRRRPDREARRLARAAWVERAVEASADRDLVFLDPDNGLVRDGRGTTRAAEKYAMLGEVARFVAPGRSVVVYHHLARRGTHDAQAHAWLAELRRLLPERPPPFGVRWRRGTSRVFFVLPASGSHATLLRARAQALEDAADDALDFHSSIIDGARRLPRPG